jgi:hypothetical protein
MRLKIFIRLFLSAFIAFVSYALWAYYANSLVTDDHQMLIKAALVQGIYSGFVTLVFTLLLEVFYNKIGASYYCLPFITPRISAKHHPDEPCSTVETFKSSIELSKRTCAGKCLPGAWLSPIPALVIQSILVIGVNVVFATPNLWLTVAPSILFSAFYGYSYSFVLARKLDNKNA